MNDDKDALNRRRRQRNLILGAVLAGLVILFYLLTIVRLGGVS